MDRRGRTESRTGDPGSPFPSPSPSRRRRGATAAAAMGVMGRLRVFVVQEPVVAASCLIAGFDNSTPTCRIAATASLTYAFSLSQSSRSPPKPDFPASVLFCAQPHRRRPCLCAAPHRRRLVRAWLPSTARPRPWMARHGQRPRAATKNGGGSIDGRLATGNVRAQHANTPMTAATTFTCSHGQQRCGAGTRLPRSGQEGIATRYVQPLASMDEKATVPPISIDSNAVDLPSEGHAQASTSNMDGGHNDAHNFYASQAQPFYYQARREAWDMIAKVFYYVLNNVRCR